MTPDYVTWMAVANSRHSIARSALPDAPIIEDVISGAPRQAVLAPLRRRLAGLIWPGELDLNANERAAPAASC